MKPSIISFLAVAFLSFEVVKSLNFTQPVLWQDLADIDLIRVENTYYYSASNMHFSPGAPILRSYDLVNWEYLSHSIPLLDFNEPKFTLQGGNAYNQGVYASSLRYHESEGLFFWAGCIQGTDKTYIFSSPEIEGPWEETSVISSCLYDNGILIDDDGTFYISYGQWVADGTQAKTWVAQLTPDLQVEKSEVVFNTTSELGYIEGSRFYKINGTYYIWLTNPGVGRGQIMIKSSGGPFGPYDEWHRVLENSGEPVPGAGPPFQGALIDTPDGEWWYMAFVDRWPAGRLPVLAPISWDEDGWPNIEFVGENTWGSSYPYPLPQREAKPVTGTDQFNSGTSLGPQYEWNHGPDNSKWSIDNGLKLSTATVTNDFFAAQNTLTHRILGPKSHIIVEIDFTDMADGDRAGLAVFHHKAGWIGISKTEQNTTIQMVENIAMDQTGGWHTTNIGDVIESVEVSDSKIWLRVECEVNGNPIYSSFSYSIDGEVFETLGQVYETYEDGSIWFLGARVGIFNYATKELGGSVVAKSFTISL